MCKFRRQSKDVPSMVMVPAPLPASRSSDGSSKKSISSQMAPQVTNSSRGEVKTFKNVDDAVLSQHEDDAVRVKRQKKKPKTKCDDLDKAVRGGRKKKGGFRYRGWFAPRSSGERPEPVKLHDEHGLTRRPVRAHADVNKARPLGPHDDTIDTTDWSNSDSVASGRHSKTNVALKNAAVKNAKEPQQRQKKRTTVEDITPPSSRRLTMEEKSAQKKGDVSLKTPIKK